MSDDLVTRLRAAIAICLEAADALERQAEQIKAIEAERDQWRTMYNAHMVHYHAKAAAS